MATACGSVSVLGWRPVEYVPRQWSHEEQYVLKTPRTHGQDNRRRKHYAGKQWAQIAGVTVAS